MKAEDVKEMWITVAAIALGHTPHSRDQVRAAIAAVAPLIVAAERERCALIADEVCDPYGADDGFSARAIAAAIRAQGDA